MILWSIFAILVHDIVYSSLQVKFWLRSRRHFKISFPRENEAVKHDLVELKVQCVKVFCCHGNRSTIYLFNSIFRTPPEVSTKLYFVEIS